MKKIGKISALCAASLLAMGTLFAVKPTASVSAEENAHTAEDWIPFNYVLTSGAGSNTQYKDIRTELDYSNGKLTATGTSTSGGMGVAHLAPIDIMDGLSVNVTLNNWQANSSDRWFGFSLTDVLVTSDKHNEVPFVSKHSEAWLTEYGAGYLFCVRPLGDGKLTVQMNNMGILGSYDADGNYSATAGDYESGTLGWLTGVVTDVQLYNADWTIKTDYTDIDFTLTPIEESGSVVGFAFEVNNGYYKRTNWNPACDLISDEAKANVEGYTELTERQKNNLFGDLVYDEIFADEAAVEAALQGDGIIFEKYYYAKIDDKYMRTSCDLVTVNNSNVDPAIFDQLDTNNDDMLSPAERENFIDGSANSDSLLKYANKRFVGYGDELYCLAKYYEKLQAANKGLYFKFMYKDAYDMREGEASFTINSFNGKAATKSETYSLEEDNKVEGKLSATIKTENFHAGVYPSMVESLKAVAVEADDYAAAKSAIEAKAGGNAYEVVSVKGVIAESKTEVSIISALNVSYDLSDKTNVKLYKINGSELEEISVESGKANVTVNSSKDMFVIVSGNAANNPTDNNGTSEEKKGGCGSSLTLGGGIVMGVTMLGAAIVVGKKKKD